MRRTAAVCAALVLAACQRTERLATTAQVGDLLIAVIAGADGAFKRAASTAGGGPIEIEAAPEDVAVLITVRGRDLVHPDGRPLSAGEIAGARAQIGPQEGCGRCLIPARSAPQVVSPGDRCAIPPFAEVQGFRATSDQLVASAPPASLLEQLRLAWPGDCPCSPDPVALRPRGRLETCLIDAPDASVAPIRALPLADGGVYGIGEGHLFVGEPDGSFLQRQIHPALTPLHGFTTIDRGQRLLLLSNGGRGSDGFPQLRHFDRRLEELPISGFPTRNTPERIFSESGDTVLYFGTVFRGLQRAPTAHRCVVPPSGDAACTELPIRQDDGCPRGLEDEGIALRAVLDNGDEILATASPLRLYFRPSRSAEIYCPPSWPAPIDYGALNPADLEVIGRRVFLCARDNSSGTDRGIVLSGELPLLEAAGGTLREPFDFSLEIAAHEGERCLGLLPHPARPGELVAFIGPLEGELDVLALSFDRRGMVVDRSTNLIGSLPGVPRPVWRAATSSATLAVVSERGATSVSVGGALFRPITTLPGPLEERPQAVIAIDDGRVAAFAGAPEVLLIGADPSAGCGGITVERIPLQGATRERGVASKVVRDGPSGSRFLVAGISGEVPWLRAVDLERRTWSEIELPALRGRPLADLTALGPGRFVLLDLLGALWVLRGTEVEPLPSAATWLSLGASHGVAWIGGDGVLGRVTTGYDGALRLEEDWLEQVRHGAFDALPRNRPPLIHGVAAHCADGALLEMRDDLNVQTELGTDSHSGWDLYPIGGRLELAESAALDRREPSVPNSEDRLVRILGPRDAPSFVYRAVTRHGLVHRPQGPRASPPFRRVQDAAAGRGFLVITEPDGRVVVALDHDP